MNEIEKTILIRNQERIHFMSIFEKAGFTHVALDETTNRYHNQRWGPRPWFFATTDHGFYLVGWRRSVYHLGWGESLCVPEDFFSKEMVAQETQVTQGSNYVHAWGEKKLIEYLQRLRVETEISDLDEITINELCQYPAADRWLLGEEEEQVFSRAREALQEPRRPRKNWE